MATGDQFCPCGCGAWSGQCSAATRGQLQDLAKRWRDNPAPLDPALFGAGFSVGSKGALVEIRFLKDRARRLRNVLGQLTNLSPEWTEWARNVLDADQDRADRFEANPELWEENQS